MDFLTLFRLADNCGTNTGVFPSLWAGITCNATGAPQINSLEDILLIIGNAVKIGMSLAGALAIVFIIVGGIFYVISLGDPSRVKRAKDIITYSVVGLIIAIIADAVITFVVNGF